MNSANKELFASADQAQEATLEKIVPDSLLFDETNPRFGGDLIGKSQATIQKMLIDQPHFASELIDSLLANGFIQYEPLIVKRSGNEYIVIEGNRRLAAIKEIRSKLAVYSKPANFLERIPALVFPATADDAAKTETRVYLGVRHLLGFREWPSFSKAQFLDNESKAGGLEDVLKEVQLTKAKAKRFLVPYRLLKAAKVSLGEDDFWMLAEALQREGVNKFIQLNVASKDLTVDGFDKAKLGLVLDDLYGPRIAAGGSRSASKRRVSDTRNLSAYSSILMSDQATKMLHEGKSLEEAAIYVDTKEQSLERLSKSTRNLGLLIKKIITNPVSQDGTKVLVSYKALDSAVKEFIKSNG